MPRVSPDGKRLAVGTTDAGTAAISIYELSGNNALRRLTLEGNNPFPAWSADGQRVAFQSDRGRTSPSSGSTWTALRRPSALPTPPKESRTCRRPGSPTATGRSFVRSKGVEPALWIHSVKERAATPLPADRKANRRRGHRLAHGRWVLYTTTAGEQGGVWLQPFPQTGAVYEIARPGLFSALVGRRPPSAVHQAQPGVVCRFEDGGWRQHRKSSCPTATGCGRCSALFYDYDVMPDGRFLAASAGWLGAGNGRRPMSC